MINALANPSGQTRRPQPAATLSLGFLTTSDPLYLPAFFATVLDRHAADTQCVYVVPPLYKNQSPRQAAWRYCRTFGGAAFLRLGWEVFRAKAKRQSIQKVCRTRGVDYQEVPDVNAPEFLAELRQTGPDLLISVSCPQIFRKGLIASPRVGILNIHGAILPQYRGVMPAFWMLANGETQAGVSIYFVNEQIDAGSLCGQRVFDIDRADTLHAFLQRSKAIAAQLLLQVLDELRRGVGTRRALNLADGSYYSWPTVEAYRRFQAAGRRLW